jgi:hypothetical protein
VTQVNVNELQIEPDLSAQLLRKDSITRLRASMDRQSQQLDKILAVHNQSRDEHQGTGERSFYRTAKKDELTLVPKKEFQTLDKPREGAVSAMLVTEHSADVYARPDA